MIWNSIAWTTSIDLLILGLSSLAIVHFYRQRSALRPRSARGGLGLILAGLLLTAIFYLADLGIMHVLPAFVPISTASDTTTALHLNLRWAVSLVSIGLVTVGVARARRRMVTLSDDLETQQSIVRQDLDTQEKLTEELRLRENMLTDTQRRLHLGHWMFDPDSHHFFCSLETRNLFGIDRRAPLSGPESLLALVQPEDRALLSEAFQRLRDDGDAQEISFRIVRPDRTERSLHVSGYRDPTDAHPKRLRGTIQDVTEWTHTWSALRESEERFQRLFELAQEGIWVVDPQTRTTLVNESMARMLGYAKDEMIGRHLSSFMDEEAAQITRQSLELRDAAIRETRDFELVRKDGSRIHTVMQAAPIHDEAGTYEGAIAGLMDVTERVEAERALRYRLDFEDLISEISTRLIGVETATIDRTIEESLEAVAGFLKADAGHVFLFSEDRKHYRLTHVWSGNAAPQTLARQQVLGSAGHPWAVRKLLNGEPFLACPVHDLPPEASLEKQDFSHLGLQSIMAAPMPSQGRVIGFTGFTFGRQSHRSTPDEVVLLMMVGRIFSNALNRKRAEEKLASALREVQSLKEQLEEENVYLQEEVRQAYGFGELVGDSETFRQQLQAVEQVAPTDLTVLLTGETGTGKELIARAIHDLSPRKERSLISVNCAALPASLIENELFGHERGAFTGADARQRGRFEMANGGTLFLDEIADLPLELQGKLLRVLQEGRFERVGGALPIDVDVRIIAATNRNLEEAVDRGRFRADLYYRINGYPIHLPPLRERKDDIPLLAKHFVRKHGPRLARKVESISARMLKDLSNRPWPGNIRELENVIERALITSHGRVLDDSGTNGQGANFPDAAAAPNPSPSLLRDAERDHIAKTLGRTDWTIEGPSGAAALLGLAPSTLRSKMKKLGILRPREAPR